MTFILTINIIIIILQITIIAAFFFHIWHFHITRKAPCVFMPKEIIPKIIEALDINKKSKFYDLGSGDGRIIFALNEKFQKTKLFGIDISPWNIFWSNVKRKKTQNNENITFIKQDIMKTDLKNATHIFAYLFPEFMPKLLPKLKKELRPGTIFISCDFTFADKKPIRTIDLGRKEGTIARHLYVYKF